MGTKGVTADQSSGVAPAGLDIWRDSPLRYLGYANEVGEAFGPLYPKYIRPSYGVAFLYVGCDTADKTWKSIQSGDSTRETAKKSGDALIWQTLASVLIPGKFIHFVTSGATHASKLSWAAGLPPAARLYGPTAIGLSAIPFIIHPIDDAVDYFMDNTFRKYV